MPRDRIVLIGSNGSGKTTLIEVIAGLLDMASSGGARPEILGQVGLAALTLELGPGDAGWSLDGTPGPAQGTGAASVSHELMIAFGLQRCFERSDAPIPTKAGRLRVFVQHDGHEKWEMRGPAARFPDQTQAMAAGRLPMAGGYLYFPSDRVLRSRAGGPIAAPPPDQRWGVRFASTDRWEGSLEQHWVWLNYLDLERAQRGESAAGLPDSIALLQQALGPGRRVSVREGRIRVTTPWLEAEGRPGDVLLDELPSGERQCAILFGEIARRRRPGAVLLIDEPEISLHATLQRHLLGSLRDLSRSLDMQVVLATHSAEIVRSVTPADVLSLDYPDHQFPGLAAADGLDEPTR
ncbi:MAG: ATP-binding protein [Deltaproteobacteria bacterium]|nr:ATP-binding protein [Deltaproteobacteria bacterium]